MNNRTYYWGTFKYSVPAQDVGERIETLSKSKGGEIAAQDIVDDARAEDSPMHELFEWRDDKAAEGFRLYQAKIMLSSLSVTIVGGQKEVKEMRVRAFSNVQAKGFGKMGVYVTTESAMQSEEQRSVILENALRELNAYQIKYSSLTELSELFEAMKKEMAKIKKESRPHGSARRQSQSTARV